MKFEKFIYKKRIKELPKELLPREKALKYGLSCLSDSELLALSIGQGTKGLNVLGLSDKILRGRTLKELKDLKVEDLMKIKGIGKAKALQIAAIFEILRRIENDEEKVVFNSPEDVYNYIKKESLHRERQEKLIGIYTNTMNELLDEKTIAIGSLNVLSAKPRDIFFPAIQLNAYGIILIHNHPGGSSKPSKEDISFTENVRDLAFKLGFELLDHIIVGKKGFFSFSREGLL